MKICIFAKTTVAHFLGGMQVHAHLLAKALEKTGHNVTIITTAHPQGKEIEKENNITIHYLSNTSSGIYSSSWWKESNQFFIHLQKQTDFDVVISEEFSAKSICGTLKKMKIPLIVFNHGFAPEHIVNEWKEITNVISFIKYFIIKIPEILFYLLLYDLPALHHASIIAPVSNRIAQFMQKFYLLPKENFFVFYNWVNIDKFKYDSQTKQIARKQFNIDKNKFIFLMTSVISKQKGLHIGVKAFAKYFSKDTNAIMWVVGNGPYLQKLKELVNKLNLEEKVRFSSSQNYDIMPMVYASADCFVLPTLRLEGLPYTLIEALSSGLPIITTSSGGNIEAVGDAGIIVKPGNIDELANAMKNIYQSAKLREQYSKTARERAEKLFSEETGSESLKQLIEKSGSVN